MFLRRVTVCQTPCILCPGPMPQPRLPAQVTLPVAPARGQQRTSEQKAHSLPATARHCSLLRAPLGSFLLFILSGSHTDTLQNSCTQHPIIRKSTLCLFYCFFKVDSHLSANTQNFVTWEFYTHTCTHPNSADHRVTKQSILKELHRDKSGP